MITQLDIARRLGVSRTLVSRALTGTAAAIGAAPATVRRICETAQAMGYRPNVAAQALRGGSTRTLGVVIKDFEDPFFGYMISEMHTLARQHGFSLVLTGGTCDPRGLFTFEVEHLLKHQLDGLLIGGSDLAPEALAPVLEHGIPAVQIGTSARLPGLGRISVDQTSGFRDLVRHLYDLGHRRFGFLGDNTPPHRRREALLKRALREHRVPARAAWFHSAPATSPCPGHAATQALLRAAGTERPSVLIAADDRTAQGALRALHDAGLHVPANVSLTGMDDIPGSNLMIPALTTVRQPVRDMVREAFVMLLAAARKQDPQPLGDIVLKPELVIRESSAAPPR